MPLRGTLRKKGNVELYTHILGWSLALVRVHATAELTFEQAPSGPESVRPAQGRQFERIDLERISPFMPGALYSVQSDDWIVTAWSFQGLVWFTFALVIHSPSGTGFGLSFQLEQSPYAEFCDGETDQCPIVGNTEDGVPIYWTDISYEANLGGTVVQITEAGFEEQLTPGSDTSLIRELIHCLVPIPK